MGGICCDDMYCFCNAICPCRAWSGDVLGPGTCCHTTPHRTAPHFHPPFFPPLPARAELYYQCGVLAADAPDDEPLLADHGHRAHLVLPDQAEGLQGRIGVSDGMQVLLAQTEVTALGHVPRTTSRIQKKYMTLHYITVEGTIN